MHTIISVGAAKGKSHVELAEMAVDALTWVCPCEERLVREQVAVHLMPMPDGWNLIAYEHDAVVAWCCANGPSGTKELLDSLWADAAGEEVIESLRGI